MADMRLAQGRLHDAMDTYEHALQVATEHSAVTLRGTADMHVGMSELHREWGDTDAALHHLQVSKDLGEHIGLRQNPYRWRVAMARIREAQGEQEEALDLINEADQLYVGDFSPDVRPVPALRARMWLRQGRVDEALGWTRTRGLSADDDLMYLREYEHITLARTLLSRSTVEQDERALQEALRLLDRLLVAADTGGRTGSIIEILILLALAHETRDDIPQALVPLERALSLARPEGYVRIFADEGSPMARLLSAASTRGIMQDYTGHLLAAVDSTLPVTRQTPSSGDGIPAQSLVDPLSPREREVLHLIAQGLSNHEIGDRLYLALSTVKGHNREIFGKLGVQRRTEAVARARKLGLLEA